MREQFYYIFKVLIPWSIPGTNRTNPISSSGHLVLAQHLLGLKIEGFSFELLVNAASLLVVLLIYRNDLTRLTKNGLSYLFTGAEETQSDFFFILYLIIATIPAGVIGVLFKDHIEYYLKGVKMVGISLIITAIRLLVIRNLGGRKNDGDLSMKDAVIVGVLTILFL